MAKQLHQIVVRARGSVQIGSGHIRRMAILARHMRTHQYRVTLISNIGVTSMFSHLCSAFDTVIEVENEAQSLTACARLDYPVSAVFFDDYMLEATDHEAYRAFAPVMAGMDDMANRPLDWDVLFDINLGRSRKDYTNYINLNTDAFFGADYQIIKQEFYDLQQKSFARNRSRLNRVFISLGGTDPLDLTTPILETVYNKLTNCQIDVVAGSLSPNFSSLQRFAATLGARVTLHADTQNVPQLMFGADLAIGAGGTMTWERNALGLPSVILIIANNQKQVGNAMQDADAAIVIDARNMYCSSSLETALEQVSTSPELLTRLSHNARNLGGTNGAKNIAKCLDRKIRGIT